MARPQPRTARELEHPSRRPRIAQCGLERRDLAEPRAPLLLAAVVAARAELPLVVLLGARPVVRDLLVEKRAIVHLRLFSTHAGAGRSPVCDRRNRSPAGRTRTSRR